MLPNLTKPVPFNPVVSQDANPGVLRHTSPFADLRTDYRVIVADPPYGFASNSLERPGRNPRRHYNTMTIPQIAALPVVDIVADDAALFLWVPGPFLAVGAHIAIMRAWGFRPTAIAFTWLKLNRNASANSFSTDDLWMGTGFTTRKNTEVAVLGKRGRSVRVDANVREVIVAARREHSRKPDELYALVERYAGECRRLDMFARQRRAGWDCFGDQIDMFSEARP